MVRLRASPAPCAHSVNVNVNVKQMRNSIDNPMITFATLGPAGSNHHVVVERYIALHRLQGAAAVEFFRDFEEGAARVLDGRADFMLQCAVHPATVNTVAKYFKGLYIVDTFISPSRDLAIVCNKSVENPRTLAVMDPTRPYSDMSRWEKTVEVPSVMAVAEGLRSGKYEAGLTYASVAEEDPDRFAVDEFIGSVDDAWIVYGNMRVSGGSLLAWPDSPAARLFRSSV